jgi:hypothetical protein
MEYNQSQEISFEIKFPVYVSFDIAMSILATIGNVIVIIVFLSDKNLKTRMHFYILSLSCADLMSGIIGIPAGLLVRI